MPSPIFKSKNMDRLDTHENFPAGFREYLENYGWHFSKKMCEFAVSRMKDRNGKKIEPYEMKMAALLILIMPIVVLGFTALAISTETGRSSILNPGPHGFSEVLYAYTSQGNNNGSAFAGLNANTPFYNLTGGLAMLISRFWLAIPTLALAGALARKRLVPAGPGTLPTHTPLFVVLLIGVVVMVGALTFLPALALGPIVEELMMRG